MRLELKCLRITARTKIFGSRRIFIQSTTHRLRLLQRSLEDNYKRYLNEALKDIQKEKVNMNINVSFISVHSLLIMLFSLNL